MLKGTLLNGSWRLDMENIQMTLDSPPSLIISNAPKTPSLLSSLLFILESMNFPFLLITTLLSALSSPASRNDDVDDINEDMLSKFPGEMKEFLSADSVKENNDNGEGQLLYPVEYLNSITCSGLR